MILYSFDLLLVMEAVSYKLCLILFDKLINYVESFIETKSIDKLKKLSDFTGAERVGSCEA